MWVTAALLALAAALSGVTLAAPAPSGAAATGHAPSIEDAGDLVIVDDRKMEPIVEGDGTTKFSLRLPAGASCPGDSANDDWRVQTYLVAATEGTPTRFGSIGPENPDGDLHADTRWALYDVNNVPWVQAMTNQNSGPQAPGLIVGVPVFDFALFDAERLPPGPYRLGVACTYFRETSLYWDTEIEVIADPDAPPGGLRWRLSTAPAGAAPASDSDDGGPWTAVALGAVAVVVILGALTMFVVRRRPPNPSKGT
jgi:hypothetical protein